MKRIFRFHLTNDVYTDLNISSYSTLPKDFRPSLSLTQKKDGSMHLTVSESLLGVEFSAVKLIEIVRE